MKTNSTTPFTTPVLNRSPSFERAGRVAVLLDSGRMVRGIQAPPDLSGSSKRGPLGGNTRDEREIQVTLLYSCRKKCTFWGPPWEDFWHRSLQSSHDPVREWPPSSCATPSPTPRSSILRTLHKCKFENREAWKSSTVCRNTPSPGLFYFP